MSLFVIDFASICFDLADMILCLSLSLAVFTWATDNSSYMSSYLTDTTASCFKTAVM